MANVQSVQDQWAQEDVSTTGNPKWMETKGTVAWFDAHGRRWMAFTAIKNKPFPAFITPPRPDGWSPPYPELLPPPQYIFAHRGNRLRIDYARWRADVRAARKERLQDLKLAARDMFGAASGDALKRQDELLTAEVGTMPLPEGFITAMESGNQWALGIRKADGSLFDPPAGAEAYIAALPSVRKALEAAEAEHPFGVPLEPEGEDTPVAFAFAPRGPATVYEEEEDAPVAARTRQRRAKKARESLAVMDPTEPEGDDE